jgi:hypothetical protein
MGKVIQVERPETALSTNIYYFSRLIGIGTAFSVPSRGKHLHGGSDRNPPFGGF